MKEDQESYWNTASSPFCNVYLSHAGRHRKNSGWNYIFGGYNCWHIVSKGSGFVKCLGKRFLLEKGDLFSVMEDAEIEYGATGENGWEFYYLRLGGPMAKAFTDQQGFTPASPVVKTGKKEEALALFRELFSAIKEGEKAPEYLSGKLLLLSHILMEKPFTHQRLPAADLVTEAEKILKDPFAGNVNINELSSMLHVSRGRLFSAFKEVTGGSPLVFLQQKRLEKICKLLKEKDLTLSQLARSSAFPNEKYLIRFFRKYMGTTPGKYRKKIWDAPSPIHNKGEETSDPV